MQRDEYVSACAPIYGYRGVSSAAMQPTRRRGHLPTLVDLHERVLRPDLMHPMHEQMQLSSLRLPETCVDWRQAFLEAREAAGITNSGSWL